MKTTLRFFALGAALLAFLVGVSAAGPVADEGSSSSRAAGEEPSSTPPAGEELQLDARAWALVEARSGEVLASHAAARRLPVASTTKLMTAYVALRELPLGMRVEASAYPALLGESLLGLEAGEEVSVRDLLYGLVLRSGNDSAVDLALAAAGSVRRFVAEMNRYAAALGLAGTHYANPIGLDHEGNFSTALDLTALTRRLLRNPAFARIAGSREAVLRSLRPRRRIETLNDFLLAVPWATGVKTGHTNGADYVLVGSGRRKGVELISAVLGAPSEAARDGETLELLEHGFARYSKRAPVRAGGVFATPAVRYTGDELALLAARTVVVGVRRDQGLQLDVRAPTEVEGPVRRGAVRGRVFVSVDGRRVAVVPLRAARAVAAASTLDRVRSFLGDNALWLLAALSAILVVAALGRRFTR